MAISAISLDDKYELQSGRVYLTGTQALVRLPMMQRIRDQKAGLNTACFVSGYRGSPLGAIDQQMQRAQEFLKKHHIVFQPGVNEDLAATAIWGSQQTNLFPNAKYDGTFGMWYGKGPGVDRSGDVFKHGNLAGSSPNGGVLLLAGDDHTCKSSTTAHQSEYAFADAMIPVLNPAGVQDFLDLGLFGWAMSRYSGCWVAFKTVAETVDSSASVYIDPHRISITAPNDFLMPEGGLNIRWPDEFLIQEDRHHRYKLQAAIAFAKANQIDKIIYRSPKKRLGIVTTGKSYLDVRQALDDLGINEDTAKEIGVSLYKVGMSWPIEPSGLREFAEGFEEILVVEEKRALIEAQIKEQLYNWKTELRPRIYGKHDEKGEWILPSSGELSPTKIAQVIAARLKRFHSSPSIEERLAFLTRKESSLSQQPDTVKRVPYFCSGCPHNTSTHIPEGSRALAGIGCHFMSLWMDRNTATFTHMGGEGASWVGQAPFTSDEHVFVNLGDGTYYHSGYLAIRQAVASGVNVTYKILYNDAVAMTGGQQVDGPQSVKSIARQVAAEGAKKVVVVSDEPSKYPDDSKFPTGTSFHHRDELDAVQRDLREQAGTTVLIYDQTCAAEKRRRRKRNLFPDPPKRVFINEAVCEGCGDCSVKSNCLSVVPVDTEFGRKRAIDQSSCNKDYSCVNGFCPSFVTVHGGQLKKPKLIETKELRHNDGSVNLPDPVTPSTENPYSIIVTGIGGTGVVTIGALLGTAAHIEGKGASVLDMAGLAQKGGAVVSHIRIADAPEDLHAVRIAAGAANAVIGCDLMVSASPEVLSKMEPGITQVVINSHETITGDFTRNPDMDLMGTEMVKIIDVAVGDKGSNHYEASRLATALLGDSIATNLFMLGIAYQKGLIPISSKALEEAIELNAVSVELNKKAFFWGRKMVIDPDLVQRAAEPSTPLRLKKPDISENLEEIISRRIKFLTAYQNEDYADRYLELVRKVQNIEGQKTKGRDDLTKAVAKYFFKILAYKDEYEVARLYTNGEFRKNIKDQFEGNYKLQFHLAPPLFSERDPNTGHQIKKEFGSGTLFMFYILSRLKFLRGTKFDPFGYTSERKLERKLVKKYESNIKEILSQLTHENHELAVAIAKIPEHIRGYGHVKHDNYKKAIIEEEAMIRAFRNSDPSSAQAAE
ncbi:MAG: indolepyruvate ferredoxin oxidoreductase family protein [Alphaproteobacteria bacterium]|nr:indolepyruvate ferredoxin oxidoreductase family protein [Alphaproteobacteria bacterium]